MWKESAKRKGRRKKIREEKESEERRSEKRKSQKKNDASSGKGKEKSRNIEFFQRFVGPEGRKGGSLKRRVRNHLGR
jgi:hypothetical protein